MNEIPASQLDRYYSFLDPHGGASDLKRTRSRAAIVTGARDHLGRIFIFHAWADRVSTSAVMDKVIEIYERFNPRVFGVEASAQQGLFGDAIARDAEWRKLRLPLAKIQQPTTKDKDDRIREILGPLIRSGRLLLLPSLVELRQELITFPMNPRRDLVDACASVCRMIPAARARTERSAEGKAHLRYLRDTGADARYIDEVARKYSGI